MKNRVLLLLAVIAVSATGLPAMAQTDYIGIAKDAIKLGRQVQLDFYIENLGDGDLTGITFSDDLDAVFGAGNYSIASAPSRFSGAASIMPNASFDGTSDTVVATGSLLIGESAVITLTVSIDTPSDQGSGLGVYSNQVTINATGPNSGAISDLSDDGTDPDPNGNNDPGDAGEDDPTSIVLFENARVGAAKSVSLNGTEVTVNLYLENFGNVTLLNLSATDDLDATFGAGNYTVTAAPSLIDDPGTIVVNAGFDGSSDSELVSSGSLAVADTAQIQFTVDVTNVVDLGDALGVYSNQITASGEGPDGDFDTDLSDAGMDPDPDGDDNPGGPDENDATPIVIGEEPVLGIAKTASVNGLDVTIDLYLENLGNVTLSNLSVIDDLNNTFGAGTFFVSTAPTLVDDPGTIVLDAAYDGNFNTDLLDTSTLAVADTAQIQFVVTLIETVDLGLGEGVYQNQATATGEAPGGGMATDSSDEGTDPDPNGNGNPDETDENDPTDITVASFTSIGIAKEFVSGGVIGSFPVVNLYFTVTNYGTETVSNISISEDLNSVYGSGNFNHVLDPEQVSGANTFNYNSAFNGSSNTAMLNGGSTLDPGETVVFRIQHWVTSLTDQGSGVGIYDNQVFVLGTDPTANPVSDQSHDGDDPDPDGDGDPTNNNTSTTYDLNQTQAIGIALDVGVVGAQVTFDFYLENLGTVLVDDLDVIFNLNSIFGEGNFTIQSLGFIDDPGTITLDVAYDGSLSNQGVVDIGSSSLAAGDTAQIQLVVDILKATNTQGLGIGNHSAQTTLSGQSTLGALLSDTSDFGTDPDPDGDGNANEGGENDATTLSFAVDSVLGVAKQMGVAGTQVTIDLYLENFGASNLSDVSLVESLDTAFGSGNYSIIGAPGFIDDPGTLTLNGSFDGSADSEIFASGSLSAGDTAQVQLVVDVTTESDQGSGYGIYSNQATATGTLPSGLNVCDLSDDGTDPDPNGNNDPSDAGEEDASSVVISVNPVIGVAMDTTVSGTVVTYNFYVENLGESTLNSVTLQNPLNGVYGSSNYSVTSQPSLISGPGTLLRSSQFFGFSVFTFIIVGGDIRPGETEHIRLQVNITTVSDQGNGFGVYLDDVTVTANAPDGTMVSDTSDSGTDPDPDGDGNPDEAGENDQNTIIIGDEAVIGVAKTASASGADVTFDFYLENFGGSQLSSLSLTDDLDAFLGAGNYSITSGPTLIDDPGTINLNGGYDGSADTELFVTGTSTLAALDTAQVRMVVEVTTVLDQGLGLGNYQNQATVYGQAPLGSEYTDISDDGTDPDPNGNGFPDDDGEGDITSFSIGVKTIGVAKNATVSGRQVTFDYYVENLGSVAFVSVSLPEDFDAVFGAGNYTIISGPTIVSAPREFTVNAGFDGSTDTELIASGGLGLGVVEQIQVVVEVDQLIDPGGGLGVYTNQVTVDGDGLTDLSDDGTDADPDGDEDPTEAGENDATAFTIAEDPIIGVAKTASVSGNQVTFNFYLENFSNVDLSNLTVAEDLDTLFGAGNYSVNSGPTLIDDPGTITVNGSFNGSGDTALITSGSLVYQDTAQIQLVVDVMQLIDGGSGLGVYSNQVTANAESPDSTATSDTSDDATDPDTDGDGNPNEAGENDATDFTIAQDPIIGVAKTVGVSGDNLTINFYLENFGNSDLENLSLPDDLDAVLGAGNYTISGGPSLIDDPGTITVNGGYDGSSDTELITTGTLPYGDTAQIQITVHVIELADLGSGLGVYSNQVTASAESPDATATSDFSDDGTDPDPNGNDDPTEAGENDTTDFSVAQDPIIGVAKNDTVSGRSVTFDFYLENHGNVELSSMALAEDLDSLLGAGNYTISASPAFVDDPGTLSLNGSYDGSSDTALFTGGTLAVGDTAQVAMTVTVNVLIDGGSGLGVYSNQVTANAEGPDTTPVSDLSDDGTDPDPNGNDDPTEAGENDATVFTISEDPVIGIAKTASVLGNQVTFDFYLEDFSNVDLSNLTIAEDLDTVFGAGTYSVNSGPTLIDDPGTITVNMAFDGSSDTALISTGGLNLGDTAQIRLVVDVMQLTDMGSGLGIYSNQVTANAESPDTTATSDLSDDGTDPDPNGSDDPTEAGENDATVFSIAEAPIVGVAKTVAVSGDDLTINFYLENLGNSDLMNLSLPDDLDAVLGAGNYSITGGPSLIDDPGTISVNGGYDGSSDTELITAGTLAYADTAQIQLTVHVIELADTGSGLGVYSNQVTVSAESPDSTPASDLSDDGTDPDPNGNGDPTEAGENDSTDFTVTQDPIIGIAKNDGVSGRNVTFDFYLENHGNVELSSVAFDEDLDSLLGAGNYTISAAPSFVDDPGTLTLNGSYDGSADTAVISSGTLAVGDTAQIQVTITINTLVDGGSGLGVYSNQVTANAQGPDSTATSDLSDDGTDPDPNGNDDPTEAGENDATAFTISEDPVIGIAKNASVSGNQVTFDFYLEDFSNVDLSNLAIAEDLDAVFGVGNYSINSGPTLIDDPGTITVNAAFDGSSDTALISSGGLNNYDTAQIQVIVDVAELIDGGSGLGVYSNQVTATAQSPNATGTSDTSDNGTDPDPDGDGNPNEAGENDATDFSISEAPIVGVAKTVAVSGDDLTINFYLENFGNTDLESLGLTDDLDAVLGAGNYTISAAPSLVDDPGTITVNAAFDGSGDTALITTGTLAFGDTAQIQVSVHVVELADTGSGLGFYSNQVTATAQSPDSTPASDTSDDGTDPDPNGNGDPTEAGENDATAFTVTQDPIVGIAKDDAVSGRDVTFDFYLENHGNVELSSLAFDEDLDTLLGAGNYTISSAPALIDDPGTITVNAAYDGSADAAVISSGSLAVGDTAQIQLTVTINTLIDGGSGLGVYSNQVTANAQGPDSTATSDLSDDGTDPDPNENDDPTEAGENDATDFIVAEDPIIGIAKNATVAGNQVTFDFYLEDFSNVDLSNLTVAEDLNAVFGAGNYSISSGPTLIDDPGTITVNAAFNGSGDTNLISSGGLNNYDTAQIQVVVDINTLIDGGSGLGVYSNQVTANAQSPNATATSDLSDSGTEPDSNGNGDPTDVEEDDPTDFTISEDPVIGVAKNATVTGSLITLDLYLENFGTVELSSLTLTDDLDAAFGAGNYEIETAPAFVDDPGTITLNGAYDGSGDTALITTGTLAVSDTAQIQIVVQLLPAANTGTYTNQASATAQSPDTTPTSDLSDDGTDPDPNGNGDPTEADENDATTIEVTQFAVVGVAKDADTFGRQVVYAIYLDNLGSDELTNLSLTDDLDAAFGAGNYTITEAPNFQVTPGTFTLNPAYDGSSDTELISVGGTLAIGASVQINMTIDVDTVTDQGFGLGIYNNQTTASADGAAGGSTNDLSDYGTETDPNGNGDPTEDGENDPTQVDIFEVASIGAAKLAILSGNQVTFDFYLGNFGNRELTNVSLPDDLDAVFGAGNYSINSGPTLLDDPGTLVVNASYDGSANNDLITSGSLATEATASIRLVVDITNVTDRGAGLGVYSNQVTASAETPTAMVVTDLSDNGVDPDPSLPESDDPTPFVIGEEVFIGAAKDVNVLGNTVTIDIYLENLGTATVSDLSLTEDLNAVFGVGNYQISAGPGFIDDPGTMTLNGSWGPDNEELLTGSTLLAGDTAQIQITVNVTNVSDQGLGLGNYENQVSVSGEGPNGQLATDLSDDGTDPDPNGNGLPNETGEDDPSGFSISTNAVIGVAKDVRVGDTFADTVFVNGAAGFNLGTRVVMDIKVENLGNVELSNLSLVDDLDSVFGDGNYGIQTPEITDGDLTVNLNANYDNGADYELLAAGSTLSPGSFTTITVVVMVINLTDQGAGLGVYSNQATGSGDGSDGGMTTDLSDAGTLTDPNGDGDPTGAGEDDPAVFIVGSYLGLALDANVTNNVVTLDLYLESFTAETLSNMSLTQNLDGVFGAGNYMISSAPAFVDDPGTLVLNGAFDGSADQEFLAAGSTLSANDTAQISFEVTVNKLINPGDGLGLYGAQAVTSGVTSTGQTLMDNSVFDTDPDPNGDDNPEEVDVTIFNVFSDAVIGAALDFTALGNMVTLDIYLENFGASSAANVTLPTDLDAVFGAGNYTITGAPAFVDDPGTLTLNAGYDGSSDAELFSSGGSLGGADTAQIQMMVEVTNITNVGFGDGVFQAQITVTGEDPNGVIVCDKSDWGVDPDPDGDGDPTFPGLADPFVPGEDDPAIITLGDTFLGIALQATVNGTEVTLDYRIANTGDIAISDITTFHILFNELGFGNFNVVSGPTYVSGSTGVSINSFFDGSFNVFLITDGTLDAGEFVRFRVVIDVTNVTDQGLGLGIYELQATTSGESPDGSTVTDLSDAGLLLSGDPTGAGNDDPTLVVIGEEAVLGVAEDVTVNMMEVTLDYYLENFGNVALDVELANDLDTVFGAGNWSFSAAPVLIVDPGTLNLNGGYDGSGDTDLLGAGSTLAALAAAQIRVVVDVTNIVDQGLGLGVYENQVVAEGLAPQGSAASDFSDAGTDPDPNGNDYPADNGEDDVTQFTLGVIAIGAAKDVSVDGYDVTIDFYIENLGNETLSNMSMVEDLDALFGAGNYTITSAPILISAPRNLVLDASYDGSANTDLLDASSTIDAGVLEQIQMVVNVTTLVDNGLGLGNYSNQVTISTGGGMITDLSDAGTDPDPDGDGNPDGANEDDPTLFTIDQDPVIGVAKDANESGSLVTMDFYLEAFGNTDLENLVLTDDLDAVFGAGNYAVTAAPSFLDDPGTITLNAAFDGSGDTALITAGTLAQYDTAQIRIGVTVYEVVDQGSGLGIYSNQVTAEATSEDGTITSDLSDDGTDPDPDGDGDPSGADEDDATGITLVPGTIGDFVWNDLNGDGVQDGGEPGIAGVDVYLDLNDNEILDAGEPVMTTDGSGAYDFTLAPDTYVVRYDASTVTVGFVLTSADASFTINLASSADDNDADFGFQQQDASIGDFVWDDLNGDGIQDGGEPGFADITVDLVRGGMVIDTQTTAADGSYDFTDLPTGDYSVEITDTNNLLTGYVLTGGADPHPVTIAAGEDYNDADFGYQLQTGTIGDFVWLDMNGDGIQDVGEPGIENVTVDLLDAVTDAVLDTQTTDANGAYDFTALPTGTYYVTVTDTNLVVSGFSLTGGLDPTMVELMADEDYNDADFGFCQPIFITQQPNSFNLCNDELVTFSVGVSGTMPYFYQWYFNGVPIPGATDGDYTIDNVRPADAGEYVCEISNGCGTVFTDPAILVVNIMEIAMVPPVKGQGLDPLSFEVAITCGVQPLSFTWENLTIGGNFGADENPVTLPYFPTETNLFQVTVVDGIGQTATAHALALVPFHPDVVDLNGDGCNDENDFYDALPLWNIVYGPDATGDWYFDVRDYLYLNTEGCPE